jgi:regulator of replication initiation timing
MAKHSISEAAKLAGVSRSHFYKKYIRPALISTEKDKDNNPVIDTSEIIRVFGRIHGDTVNNVSGIHNHTLDNDTKNTMLQTEIQLLREQLAAAQERDKLSGDREKWMQKQIDQLANQLADTTRLLEYKTSEPPKKRSWWPFGRG